jgi:hypothetical protein
MSSNCNPLKPEEYDNELFQCGFVKTLIAKDRGRHHYQIQNISNHYLVRLRLVEEQRRKCDYLILDCSSQKAFFVELKGQNLGDAVKQIESTLAAISPRLISFHFYCRIVQTRVIKASNQNDKERLIRYLKENHKENIQGSVTDLVKIGSVVVKESI